MLTIVNLKSAYELIIFCLLSGPDHITIIMSPQIGVDLINSSWTMEPPVESLNWVDRKTYFIYYSYGEYKEPWIFSIDLKVCIAYCAFCIILSVFIDAI